MQALTPGQEKMLTDFAWQAIDKGIWALLVWGGWRVKKSIASIPTDIASSVTQSVSAHFDGKLDEHKQEDRTQFQELRTLILSSSSHRRPASHSGD